MSEIKNLPEIGDKYEACIGPCPEWDDCEGLQFLSADGWINTTQCDSTHIYRRLKLQPKPEPEKEIRLPIDWGAFVYPVVRVRKGKGVYLRDAVVKGLRHIDESGNEYRLLPSESGCFQYADGSRTDEIGWDGEMATHAVFTLERKAK